MSKDLHTVVIEVKKSDPLPPLAVGGYLDSKFTPPALRLDDSLETLPDGSFRITQQWQMGDFSAEFYPVR